jgi:predicted naringenin-chalcone synthase
MHFRGIGTATPPVRYSKAQCLAAFERSDWYSHLNARAHQIASRVLQHDNGIEARRLALDSLDEAFVIEPDVLARRFLRHAPALAADAARTALAQAKLASGDIGAVVVSTCTGYACPGLSGYVVEALGLRRDILTFDLVGQGCAAAVPNLQICRSLLHSGECEHALSVCVEVSSAAMYLDDDPGVVISACLFGDGAGAAVVSRQAPAASQQILWVDSGSRIDPEQRGDLMFEQRRGMLRNVLGRSVPVLAAQHAQRVLDEVLGRAGLKREDVSTWIFHPGGRDVLLALERQLHLDAWNFRYSAAILREFGNLSSASVYFVLEAALQDSAHAGWWWLSSFGAGFACHGALLRVSR